MTLNMATVCILLPQVHIMKVSLLREKGRDKGLFTSKMRVSTKGSGLKGICMGRVLIPTTMGRFTKDNSKKENALDSAHSSTLTEINIMENGKKMKSKVKGPCFMPVEIFMQETGKREKKMVKLK